MIEGLLAEGDTAVPRHPSCRQAAPKAIFEHVDTKAVTSCPAVSAARSAQIVAAWLLVVRWCCGETGAGFKLLFSFWGEHHPQCLVFGRGCPSNSV